jgi:chromate transport protein ChrA
VNFFYPATILPNYSVISFAGFHTMFYHSTMLFIALTVILKGYNRYKAEKWIDLLYPSVVSLVFSVPVVIIDYVLKADYMWFRWDSTFLPPIFGNTPKPVVTVIIYALYIIVPALFYLPSFIKNQISKKSCN